MSPLKNNITLLLCLFLGGYTVPAFTENADREKPILMEADRVTVDDANQTSTFEGRVQLRQGTLLIEGGKVVVKQDKKGYNQVVATGQLAHFRQKREGLNEYAEGYGERIEYDSFVEIANIYGQARIKREGDDVQGEHIVYNTKTGVFQVFGTNSQNPKASDKGRVTVVIQPKAQTKAQIKNQTNESAPGDQPPAIKPPSTQPQPKQ